MSKESAYARAGVDISAGQRATALLKAAVQATHGPEVLAGVGAFGGLYDASALQALDGPVLVASTDGVGTKTMVAARLDRWETIGADLVNHCINDVLVMGARPLFFLDYIASAHLEPETVATVVAGMASACRAAGCALLGGETAEMPGVYHDGAVDVVGTMVGVVARTAIVDGSRIVPGDAILGLPSSGLHTNGYTLARRALAALDWEAPHPGLGGATPGAALLATHVSYLDAVQTLRAKGIEVHGLAHITGGGLIDNPPRVLPPGTAIRLSRGAWPVPPIFDLVQKHGAVDEAEMFHVFNMGLGLLVFLDAAEASAAQTALGGAAHVVGTVTRGAGTVTIA